MRNLFEAVDAQKFFTLDEAKVTDYIDADKLGEICSTNPILKTFNDCEPIEGMVLKMTGDMGVSYYKVIKNDDGDFEAYLIGNDGRQLGDPFLLESKLNESIEDGEAFWSKGFKVGDKIPTSGAGEVELLDLNQAADYILVKRNTEYDPFVAAWAPELFNGKVTWGQGHYFNDEENAREYFNNLNKA